MLEGMLPQTSGPTEKAYCLTLYDWPCPVNETWLQMAMDIFQRFKREPIEGTGSFRKKTSHGAYIRTRRRLAHFLENAATGSGFDIRLRGMETNSDEGHFPTDIEFSFGGDDIVRGRPDLRKLCFAVRENLAPNLSHFIGLVCSDLLAKSGPCYGAAFEFPAMYGPSCYFTSVSCIPKGESWQANRSHATRITRWRDRTRRDRFKPSDGYFREVYQTNLVTEAHLNMPFRDEPLRVFAEQVGDIQILPFCEGVFRWDIEQNILPQVQKAMETSGLVLSSEFDPIRIN